MKKILIIGNRRHQFITNYIKWFRECNRKQCRIDILSYETDGQHYETDCYYDRIYTLRIPNFMRKVKILSIIFRHLTLLWNFRILSNYDIVHVHYVEDYLSRFSRLFSKLMKGKLLISVWGSDFLKASDSKLRKMYNLYERADIISIVSDDVKDCFVDKYSNIKGLSNKIVNLKFGLAPLDALHILPSKRKDRDNICITIGYNARRNQQHLKIIKILESSIDLSSIKDRIKFIIPLTYPENIEYIKEITDLTNNSKFTYTLLTDFMKDDEVAKLRNKTDIFIQLQETDMMSGSMLEHIAASNIVITGSWLPYSNLEKLGLVYWKIDNTEDVSDVLFELINKFNSCNELIKNNREIVFSNYQWKKVIESWINVTLK